MRTEDEIRRRIHTLKATVYNKTFRDEEVLNQILKAQINQLEWVLQNKEFDVIPKTCSPTGLPKWCGGN